MRKIAYNMCTAFKEGHKERTLNSAFEKDKEDKIKKYSKHHTEINSLKDTVSTQSCKSLPLMKEPLTPSFGHFHIKLDDFDPLRLLGKGKMG